MHASRLHSHLTVRFLVSSPQAKLYDLKPGLVEEHGFLDMLRELICDANPTVVANAVAALTEIQVTTV